MADDSRNSRISQIGIYLGKCFRIFRYEKGWKVILFGAVISAIIAWVPGDEMFVHKVQTKNGAFAIVCACIWIGLFNSIESICRERKIIKREHRTGLHISSYVLAHMIYELFLSDPVSCYGGSTIVFPEGFSTEWCIPSGNTGNIHKLPAHHVCVGCAWNCSVFLCEDRECGYGGYALCSHCAVGVGGHYF